MCGKKAGVTNNCFERNVSPTSGEFARSSVGLSNNRISGVRTDCPERSVGIQDKHLLKPVRGVPRQSHPFYSPGQSDRGDKHSHSS